MMTPLIACITTIWRRRLLCAVAAIMLQHGVHAQAPAAPAERNEPATITMTEALVIGPVGRYGRSPIHCDAIEDAMLRGEWRSPQEGGTIESPDGASRLWHHVAVNDEQWLRDDDLRGGYACWTVTLDSDVTMILSAQGHSAVCVNGEWRIGDVYALGFVNIPVELHAGENQLLFHVARGQLKAQLRAPRGDLEFNPHDRIVPSLIAQEPADAFGSINVVNATNEWRRDLVIRTNCPALAIDCTANVPAIPPLTVRNVPFRITCEAPREPGEWTLTLQLAAPGEQLLAAAEVPLKIVTPRDTIVRTFISTIDGSVQYYGLRYAAEPADGNAASPPGVILTLHGASVEAAHQASCYTPKPWAHIVAPTNRRPFGFDWEDWGRLDALEALDHAVRTLGADASRVAVTGHSMGGHGTWQLAVHNPEKFVAAAPSAGWASFRTYTGASTFDVGNPIEAMFERAAAPSQTLNFITNLRDMGVYILHGDADDNVPVEQARMMRRALAEFHPDFAYHEEPGAGHWWGDECMDYPPLMALIERRMRDAAKRRDRNAPSEPPARRPGPFKEAFRNRFMFVVGTQGSAEENAALWQKARYDAETFWYRGNGSIDIVLDRDFDAAQDLDRNIILYGNADTNLAWPVLLADSPIEVRRGEVTIGGRSIEGDDLACIMIRPRRGADGGANAPACIGVIAGTSARGVRLAMRLPVFVSGVAYPDFMVWRADALTRGLPAVRSTGYFADDWSLNDADIAWSDGE